MKLEVNGVNHEIRSGPLVTLLNVLRDELTITGPKAGCQAGGCGACAVLVDGEPQRSCLTPVAAVDGKSITTVEGLGSPQHPSPVQQSFIHHYAAQCGFCTPGMVVAATAYIENGGSDDKDEIVEAISGHVCRCTGYSKILDAIAAATKQKEFDLTTTAPDPTTVVIGGSEE
jgi:aerobic-type carbon monoxide dehydrogenase small subunit (CoxS/CutS family)